MRLAWLGLFTTFLCACSASISGTGAAPASETSEEPTTPSPGSIEESGTQLSGDAGNKGSATDDSDATIRANGTIVAVTKGVASVQNGTLQVQLREKADTLSQPIVVLILERTGSGCTRLDGGGASQQLVLWYPSGIGKEGPTYQSSASATCGLTIARADMVVGGRAAGAFDGEVRDTAKNLIVHLSLTFNVPVRASLK